MYDHPTPLIETATQIAASSDRNWYVGGHFSLTDLDEHIGLKSEDFIFSVVRDPMERFLSLYRLLTRSPEWLPQVKQAAGKSIDYFYDCCIENRLLEKNTQCLSISGKNDFATANAAIPRYSCLGSMSDFSGFLKILECQIYPKTGIAFKYLDTDHNTGAATNPVILPSFRSRIEEDFSDDFMLVAEVERRQAEVLKEIQ